MAVIKHEFPVLDFDTDTDTIFRKLMETQDHSALPEKAVFAFTGPHTDTYADMQNARTAAVLESVTRDYNIYIIERSGQEIALMQAPMGAPAALQNLEFLIASGVKKILATGSCGVLTDIPENRFIVPVRAVRAEGSSYQYIPPSRFIDLDSAAVSKLCGQLDKMNIPYQKCTTWTTDCLFRETEDMVRYRLSEGCAAVDMECSALAACAKFHGVSFSQLFFTADSLADVRNYDPRGFGVSSREKAIDICVDIIAAL